MASKFQNRMAGTIILVALGVIILPGLLDGKKKHYQEEFAAIPLVPKPGDQLEEEMAPPVTQPLPSQTIRQAAAQQVPRDTQTNSTRGTVGTVNNPEQVQQRQLEEEQLARDEARRLRQQAEQQQQQQQRLAAQRLAESRAQEKRAAATVTPPATTPTDSAAPVGQAYVIQLGALRNAQRVSEVVSQLRSEGFKAYSLPATPVQGQINRILVGPDASKSHLQSQIASLKAKTGLFGVVMPYRVH